MKKGCGGVIARYRKNIFISSGTYAKKERLIILKRKSCKGCPRCDGIKSHLQESVYWEEDLFCEHKNLNDGDLVEIYFSSIGGFNGESEDDIELCLRKLKPQVEDI